MSITLNTTNNINQPSQAFTRNQKEILTFEHSPDNVGDTITWSIVEAPISNNNSSYSETWVTSGAATSTETTETIILNLSGTYKLECTEVIAGVTRKYLVFVQCEALKDLVTTPFPGETTELNTFKGWSRKVENSIQSLAQFEGSFSVVGSATGVETYSVGDVVVIKDVLETDPSGFLYELEDATTTSDDNGRVGIVVKKIDSSGDVVYDGGPWYHVIFQGAFIIESQIPPFNTTDGLIYYDSTNKELTDDPGSGFYVGKYLYDAVKGIVVVIEVRMVLDYEFTLPSNGLYYYNKTFNATTDWSDDISGIVAPGDGYYVMTVPHSLATNNLLFEMWDDGSGSNIAVEGVDKIHQENVNNSYIFVNKGTGDLDGRFSGRVNVIRMDGGNDAGAIDVGNVSVEKDDVEVLSTNTINFEALTGITLNVLDETTKSTIQIGTTASSGVSTHTDLASVMGGEFTYRSGDSNTKGYPFYMDSSDLYCFTYQTYTPNNYYILTKWDMSDGSFKKQWSTSDVNTLDNDDTSTGLFEIPKDVWAHNGYVYMRRGFDDIIYFDENNLSYQGIITMPSNVSRMVVDSSKLYVTNNSGGTITVYVYGEDGSGILNTDTALTFNMANNHDKFKIYDNVIYAYYQTNATTLSIYTYNATTGSNIGNFTVPTTETYESELWVGDNGTGTDVIMYADKDGSNYNIEVTDLSGSALGTFTYNIEHKMVINYIGSGNWRLRVNSSSNDIIVSLPLNFTTYVTPTPASLTYYNTEFIDAVHVNKSMYDTIYNFSDSDYVHITGTEIITGEKTFNTAIPKIDKLAADFINDKHIVNKEYVTSAIGAAIVGINVFESSGGVIRQVSSYSEDFVFGSTQVNDTGDTAHDNRMVFHKVKGAMSVGTAESTQFNTVGTNSFRLGKNVSSLGDYTLVGGLGSTMNGLATYSFAWGYNLTVNGSRCIVTGGAITVDDTSTYNAVSGIGHDLLTGSSYNAVYGSGNDLTTSSYNIVSGLNNELEANSDYNAVFGKNILVSSISNLVAGEEHDVDGIRNLVAGYSHTLNTGSDYNAIFGNNHTITGDNNLISGNTNTIVGNQNLTSGAGHNITGNYNATIGLNNTVSTSSIYSLVGGVNSTATNCQRGFAWGSGVTVGAAGDVVFSPTAFGLNTQATKSYTIATGYASKTHWTGSFVQGSGQFSEAGDAQYARTVLRGRTTGAVTETLYFNDDGTNTLDIPEGYSFSGLITCVSAYEAGASCGGGSPWGLSWAYIQVAGANWGGTIYLFKSGNNAIFDVDSSGSELRVRITGTANPARYAAKVDLVLVGGTAKQCEIL